MRLATMRPWQNTILAAFVMMVSCLAVLQIGGTTKVYADGAGAPYQSARNCGVGTGDVEDYAGLLVEVYWFDSNGGLHTANDSPVRIWTDDARYDKDPGNIKWMDSSNLHKSSYPSGEDMTFQQYDSGCGDGHNVVLGYYASSARDLGGGNFTGWGPWVLDCDASQYKPGNERWFNATGVGVPTGAHAGGTWEVKTFQAKNGLTRLVTLAYQEPDPGPIGVFDGANCSWAWGWAFDPSRSGDSIRADLQVDGDTKIWANTDQDSGDVSRAYNSQFPGISGKHRFKYDISSWISDGAAHTIDVYTYNINSSGTITGGARLIGTKTVGSCYDYDLNPYVSSTVGDFIEAGDALGFTYSVQNIRPSASPAVAVAVKQYEVPPGQDLLTYNQVDGISVNPCKNEFSTTLCAATWQLSAMPFARGTTPVHTTSAGSPPPPPQYFPPRNTSTLPAGTKVCQILAVDPAVQKSSTGGYVGGRWSAPKCVTIVAKPYFTVTGGDISSNGNIKSWNVNNVGGAGYAGAGSQLAALAFGNISSFVTGKGLSAIGNGSGLAFANTDPFIAPTYGKGFTPTITTPTVDTTGALQPSPTPLASWDGVYAQSGNLTLSGNVTAGKNVTVVLNSGSLYIGNSGITYGAYTTLNVPRLTVIVKNGNIYVNSNVQTVHGVFYAGDNDAADGVDNGNFYSCATASGITSTDYTICNNKLTVYGAVTANKLVLSRTYGTLHGTSAPGSPAENFYYSPEVWLAKPSSTSTNSNTIYNSYVNLPPIL